jgi:hypothetical protein
MSESVAKFVFSETPKLATYTNNPYHFGVHSRHCHGGIQWATYSEFQNYAT